MDKHVYEELIEKITTCDTQPDQYDSLCKRLADFEARHNINNQNSPARNFINGRMGDCYFEWLNYIMPKNASTEWNCIQGVSNKYLKKLMAIPNIPSSLINLLLRLDGTDFRKYPAGDVGLPAFCCHKNRYNMYSAEDMLTFYEDEKLYFASDIKKLYINLNNGNIYSELPDYLKEDADLNKKYGKTTLLAKSFDNFLYDIITFRGNILFADLLSSILSNGEEFIIEGNITLPKQYFIYWAEFMGFTYSPTLTKNTFVIVKGEGANEEIVKHALANDMHKDNIMDEDEFLDVLDLDRQDIKPPFSMEMYTKTLYSNKSESEETPADTPDKTPAGLLIKEEKVFNTIAEKYLYWLQEDILDQDALKNIEGATPEDIVALKQDYPDVPETLITILRAMDGTYYREYPKGKVCTAVLASDVMPHYLCSAAEMLKGKNDMSINDIYGEDEAVEWEIAKKGVSPSAIIFQDWLHFSDCTNNGGSASLYIDFLPGEGGKYGQIVRFVHDPDEYAVIADSFDEYLEKVMDEWSDMFDDWE